MLGPLIFDVVGKGRAVSLIAGPAAKKRKLNAISNEDTLMINPEGAEQLRQENDFLKARLAEAEGLLALGKNGSGALPGLINKFNI